MFPELLSTLALINVTNELKIGKKKQETNDRE
jgi:hypothetical protein